MNDTEIHTQVLEQLKRNHKSYVEAKVKCSCNQPNIAVDVIYNPIYVSVRNTWNGIRDACNVHISSNLYRKQ